MSRYSFSLALADDDAQLRERMAADWIEGAAAISIRREPSYFASSRLLGNPVQVIVGRDAATGQVLSAGSRCISTVFIEGAPQRVAYLADLRIQREHRNGMLLARTFRFLRTLHNADQLPCYALIHDDNANALEALCGARAGMPLFVARGRLTVPALLLKGRQPELVAVNTELRRARADELPEIVRFLNRRNAAYRWAPVLDEVDFRPGGRCDTLHAEDFFIARRQGRICATIATWDQAALRQAHIERYPRALGLLRPLHSLIATMRQRPTLPAPGSALRYVYLAFVAVENDELALGAALLRHVYNALCHRQWFYALAALHDDDPLLPLFAAYPATTSAVRLFEVDFNATSTTPADGRARVEFALS